MFTKVALSLALIQVVLAQAPLYGQCGGEGWTGATTCVAGAVCVEQNAYYYQCVVGTATSTTTTSGGSSTTKTTTTTTTSPVTTATQYCGQWDDPTFGEYILYLDQWGESGATSGSDCAWVTAQSGNSISWVTQWTWVGGTGVKSFTNVAQTENLGLELSAITSIPTTWDWTITNSDGIVADVAYDMFTSTSASGGDQYEIMIWLANYNAGPISYTYSSSGSPTPVASAVSIGGYTWDVYYGNNGSNYVYSFLPSSGSPVQSFSSDIMDFFNYLIEDQAFSSTQYLTTLEAGTEATTGSDVTLTTTTYSVVIN